MRLYKILLFLKHVINILLIPTNTGNTKTKLTNYKISEKIKLKHGKLIVI